MSWLSEVSARAETAEELEPGMARVAAMYESAADVPRLVALVEQLGNWLENADHEWFCGPEYDYEGYAEFNAALAAYREATKGPQ